jgi:hypothetical protein
MLEGDSLSKVERGEIEKINKKEEELRRLKIINFLDVSKDS